MRLALCIALLSPIWGQGALTDYQRFLGYAEWLRPLTAGIASDVLWIEKSNRFWYSRTTTTGTEFITATANGDKQPAFDHAARPVKPRNRGQILRLENVSRS